MRLLIHILFFMLFGHCLIAQEDNSNEEYHHCFLQEKSFSIGLGVPYAINMRTIGVNSRLYYNVGEKLCFGPEVSIFQNSELETLDLNLVVHYIFETPLFGIYPVTGINLTKENENEYHEEAFGFVYGAGIHRNFKHFMVFSEYTRVESQLQDQFFTAGLMYMFRL